MKKQTQDESKKGTFLQWHPAFFAGIQIELEDEADKLTFEREYALSTKPMLIDVVIIKKNTEDAIKKNIGRIFKKYNIIEYKSPDDYLSIDDFYKVYGYACFYKSSASKQDYISANELTITFVSKSYPRKMVKHLKKIKGYSIKQVDKGIYYIFGDLFPMQLIVTSRLSPNNNLWLSSLTNDLEGHGIINTISNEYKKHKREELYKSMMNIIIRANKEVFKEERDMCEAILELFEDEVNIRTAKARNEGKMEGKMEGKLEGRLEERKEGVKSMINSCKALGASKEKVLELLVMNSKITQDEAMDYIEKYW